MGGCLRTSEPRQPASGWSSATGGATHRELIARPQERPRKARRRRSNRPGNSQAKGLRAEGHSGKQRMGFAARPLTEGVSPPHPNPPELGGVDDRVRAGEFSQGPRQRGHRRTLGVRSVGGDRVPPGDAASLLRRTPLYPLHQSLGARMVPFAGYEMPVQYPAGILAEHLHTRARAGLFDVSHMGQLRLAGSDPAAALEALVPGDIRALGPMRMRYTLLLNHSGGILDDLMSTRARRRVVRRRQRGDQGRRSRPSARTSRRRRDCRTARRSRLAGIAGAGRCRGSVAPRRWRRSTAVHDRGRD